MTRRFEMDVKLGIFTIRGIGGWGGWAAMLPTGQSTVSFQIESSFMMTC